MLSVYNNGQGIVVWPANLQVTKVLPMENYYARGEGIGDGWSRNAHLPPVTPTGLAHTYRFTSSPISALMFSTVCSESFHSAQTLHITYLNPPPSPRITVTVSPALHGISWALLGNALRGTERRNGDGEPVFLKETWKRICKCKKEREEGSSYHSPGISQGSVCRNYLAGSPNLYPQNKPCLFDR